ncbi:MAG: SUMF1/EgtB/PvdO family nonheme iron enzyme [Planctomycetes bacterium]|nr:SUMF1/EgtB/PvdO family nonheme iron enzyme [Planctomycetota bacterium]
MTQAQFTRFLDAVGRTRADLFVLEGQAREPVRGVDWRDAMLFCRWAGLTLPERVPVGVRLPRGYDGEAGTETPRRARGGLLVRGELQPTASPRGLLALHEEPGESLGAPPRPRQRRGMDARQLLQDARGSTARRQCTDLRWQQQPSTTRWQRGTHRRTPSFRQAAQGARAAVPVRWFPTDPSSPVNRRQRSSRRFQALSNTPHASRGSSPRRDGRDGEPDEKPVMLGEILPEELRKSG